MLTIRESQSDALEGALRAKFVDKMMAHLTRHFPDSCQKLGSAKLREVVVEQWIKANQYGFETEYGVCQYLNLVFSFGDNFDTDLACEWAQPYLNAENDPSEEYRADRLHDEALHQLR